jgi:hypothetical protein
MNYHAYDDAWVPATLAGKTIAEVGTHYDGDLLGDTPKRHWDHIVAKAVSAVEALTILLPMCILVLVPWDVDFQK